MIPQLEEQLARIGWQNDRTAIHMFSQYPERYQQLLANIVSGGFSPDLIRKHLLDEEDGKRINAFLMSAHWEVMSDDARQAVTMLRAVRAEAEIRDTAIKARERTKG